MSTEDGSIHERELSERDAIIDACPIDIYVASINPRWGYPHKLMSYYEARPGVGDSCRALIVDSGYSRVGEMDEILDAAVKVGADVIIPPDITPGVDGYEEEGDALAHADEMEWYYWDYERHDFDGDILVPIQAPYLEHIDALRNWKPDSHLNWKDDPAYDWDEDMVDKRGARPSMTVDWLQKFDGVAIGGLRNLQPHRVVRVLRSVRGRVPASKHIHALAPGTDMDVLTSLRDEPELVDSLDVSTPETAPANNKVPDNTWKQHMVPFPRGTDVTTLRGARSTTIALQLNHMLSDLCDDSEFPD